MAEISIGRLNRVANARAFVVLLPILSCLCGCLTGERGLTSARRELVAALDGKCPVEGRLTGFPLPPRAVSGGAQGRATLAKKVQGIVRLIEAGAGTEPSPRALADLAVLALMDNRFDRAVAALERSVRMAPRDANLWNDLAVAYLSRARGTDQPQDFLSALAAADRALELGGERDAFCFNRALTLEGLFLATEARSAWTKCLASDRMVAWRAQARAHLAELDRPAADAIWDVEKKALQIAALRGDEKAVSRIVGSFTQDARQDAEEKIAAWAEAQLHRRDSQAERELNIARRIGSALAAKGEHMVEDSVQTIDGLRHQAPLRDELLRLAKGHLDYARGLREYQQGSYDKASGQFRKAEAELGAAVSPFVFWVRLQIARCAYQRSAYKEVDWALAGLLKRSGSRYPTLSARALWVRGLVSSIRGKPSEAMDQLTSALTLFDRVGEKGNGAAIEGMLAEVYEAVGDPLTAWRHRWRAMAAAKGERDTRLLYATWEQGAVTAIRMTEPRLALYFQNEIVQLAHTSGNPVALIGGLRGRATIHLRLGETAAAEADLEEAKRALSKIPDPAARQTLEADLLLVAGEARLRTEPRVAAASLGEALRIYRATDYTYLLSQALVDRARAYRGIGAADLAEADLAAAIESWEHGRQDLPKDPLRSAFFDKSRALFSEMIEFQVDSRKRADLAFSYTERAKGRVLLDWVAEVPGRLPTSASVDSIPLAFREIQAALSPDITLVQYWVLEDRLLIWTVQRSGARWTMMSVRSSELATVVRKFVQAVQNSRQLRLDGAARRASALLWDPIRNQVPPSSHVVFIPDLMLYQIPFAALTDSHTGKYLIEKHSVSIAPSASLFVAASAERRARASRPAKEFLIIENPSFDRNRFPDLARLTSANRESEAVRGFNHTDVVVGPSATKASFLNSAGKYRNVHFVGHSVVNAASPLNSFLVFAPDAQHGDSGALYAYELLDRRFNSTCLLVLSACSTARGQVRSLEGASGIVRPFLAAGIPAVIATLWDVKDVASARFFESFYKAQLSGADVVEALRSAQLELLARGEPPLAWAAFELTGSL